MAVDKRTVQASQEEPEEEIYHDAGMAQCNQTVIGPMMIGVRLNPGQSIRTHHFVSQLSAV